MARKAEFPALLPGGFHSLTVAELRARCVDDFPLSKTRPKIMASLEAAIARVKAANIPADLWIDGSFITRKIDPSDVDLAIIVPFHVHTAASAVAHQTLDWIESDEAKDRDL